MSPCLSRSLGERGHVQLRGAGDGGYVHQVAALHLERLDQVRAEHRQSLRGAARRGMRPTTSSRLRAMSLRKGKSS